MDINKNQNHPNNIINNQSSIDLHVIKNSAKTIRVDNVSIIHD